MEFHVKVLRNGRITIPAVIRRELGIDEQTIWEVEVTEDRAFRLKPIPEDDERRGGLTRRLPGQPSQLS